MTSRTITVVATSDKPGRCRTCKAHILWVTVVAEKGRPARALPFDTPKPFPLSTVRNDETRVALEVWPRAALHFNSCVGVRP